nr:hypothetical protein 3 [Hubei tombus-like virus 38]
MPSILIPEQTAMVPMVDLENATASLATRVVVLEPRQIDLNLVKLPETRAKYLRTKCQFETRITEAEAAEIEEEVANDPDRQRPYQDRIRKLVAEFIRDPRTQLPTLIQPMPLEEYVTRYKTAEQRHLIDEAAKVRATFVANSSVKAFIKQEAGPPGDPRNISPRSPGYKACLGPYIAAFEAAMKNCSYLIKGLTLPERNVKMSSIMMGLYDGSVIDIDFSRFDMHIQHDVLLYIEHECIKYAFGYDPFLCWLLDMQLVTKGYHVCGVAYRTKGGRCSGDVNTSIGNALINRFCSWYSARTLKLGDNWESFHEGDDTIWWCSGLLVRPNWIMYVVELCHLRLGFPISISLNRTLDTVDFCGRVFYTLQDKVMCMADPVRTLQKFCITSRPVQRDQYSPTLAKELLLAKAMAYFSTDRQMPIIGPLCWWIIQLLKFNEHVVPRFEHDMQFRIDLAGVVSKYEWRQFPTIPDEARTLFFLRTGIYPQEQVLWERVVVTLPFIPEVMPQLRLAQIKDFDPLRHMPIDGYMFE